jgi:O-antigen/teichoic acid export membrane protein
LLKELAAYGAPLALTFMLVLIVDLSDRLILGWLIGPEAVGGYAAAYDLAQQSLGMLTGVVHLAAFPLAVRAFETGGVAEARAHLQTSGYTLLAIALPATIGLVMLANNIATVMLGSEFRESAGVIMRWVALAVLVGTLKAYYLDYSFQLGRRMRTQVWTVGIAAITNVTLNLLLIPVHGPLGAAYATLGAFVAGFSVSWYLGRKIFPLPLPRQLYKPLLASCGMAAVLWPTISWRSGRDLMIQVVIGVFAYALSLLALNLTMRAPGRVATYFSERSR